MRPIDGEFERATRVEVSGSPASGVSTYTATVQPGWDIGGNANGGYLLAIVGRAMADVAGRPPLSLTAHYLAPAPAGPCTIEVGLVRAGRRTATVTAVLRRATDDGEREVLRALGTFAEQEADDGPLLVDGAPPVVPPYDECTVPAPPDEGPLPAITERLAVRLRPGDDGFRHGRPTGRAEMAGWFAYIDEKPVDAIGLLLVADAFPPPVFNTDLPVGWVPTLELTVHVRGVPAPGPLQCVFRSRFVQGGLVEEDGEIWDGAGRLVCQSRQLSLTPRG